MERPFLVCLYHVSGTWVGERFINKLNAFYYAEDQFKKPEVYKIKVWDLRISDPVPNVEDHPALLLHLV
jgi:hypothetical protein